MKAYISVSVGLIVLTLAAVGWSYFWAPDEVTVSEPVSIGETSVPGVPATTTPPGTGGPMLPPISDEMPTGQQKVRVGVGETGSTFGLSVTLNNIVNDSRCPVDAQCIWAGMLVAEITLAEAGASETVELQQDDVREWRGYSVTMVSAEPIPRSDVERKPEDYFLTFMVMK